LGVEAFSASPELEELRAQILRIERELARHGFDPRRGIESYKVGELRSLLRGARNREEVRGLLLALIELQEKLYRELYRAANLKEMRVDTETPEKNLVKIKRWLLEGRADGEPRRGDEGRSLVVLRRILEKVADLEDDEECAREIESLLRRAYKRDYDRCRIVKAALDACVMAGALERSEVEKVETSLRGALALLLKCRKTLKKDKISELIASGGVE